MADDADNEAYLDAAARLMELPILPEHRAEVLVAFAALQVQAELLDRCALPDEVEAAPRFVP